MSAQMHKHWRARRNLGVTHQIKVSSHFKVYSGHTDAHIPGACLIVGVKIGHSTQAFADSLFIEIVERGDFSHRALVSA